MGNPALSLCTLIVTYNANASKQKYAAVFSISRVSSYTHGLPYNDITGLRDDVNLDAARYLATIYKRTDNHNRTQSGVWTTSHNDVTRTAMQVRGVD